MHAPRLLRQRAGHKVLMGARLLREHRPLRDASSSATAPMSQQHSSITGAITPYSYRNINATDGEKSRSIVCFYVMGEGGGAGSDVLFLVT